MSFVNCAICGAQVERTSPNRRYCAKCARKARRIIDSQNKQEERAKIRLKKKVQTYQKPSLTLSEVNELARKAGMSYGKYVATRQ